ncbi:MAG: helix-turn-helix transcriptional regulator [Pseudomonadota bacterium]
MSTRSPSDTDEYVGEQLRRARKANKLTQQELAGRLGISAQQLQKYETGYNRIPAGRLHELALILDLAIADCFPPSGLRTSSASSALNAVEAREVKARLRKQIDELSSLEALNLIMGVAKLAARAEQTTLPMESARAQSSEDVHRAD